ncbi:MAG: hypothetical protein OEV21_06680 [Thermoplasmata archaeon]|nr:hypothetical protein [Thermoplasmata archaeon]
MKGCLYCPKCDKSVPKEELEQRAEQVRRMFGSESLKSGICPVCGTAMIDVDQVKGSARE